jgi:hypothetical protein
VKQFQPVYEPGANWPPEIDHISATSLKMFGRCPEQWRRRYLKDERARPSGALIQGKADHFAIESSFIAKQHDGFDLAVDEVKELFAVRFDEEIDWAGGHGEIEWDRSHTLTAKEQRKRAGTIKTDGVDLCAMYRQEVSPLVWPVEVEKEFTIRPAGIPVDIQGRLDLVADDFNPMTQKPVEKTRKLVERKTTRSTGVAKEWTLQAMIYQLAEPTPLDFHLSHKAGRVEWGTPELRVETSEKKRRMTAQLVSRSVMQIAQLYQSLGPDEPWPDALTHSWACNYCGWSDVCYWRTNM